jgi:hypothetical protein
MRQVSDRNVYFLVVDMDTNMMTQTIPKFNINGDLSGHALFNEWIEWKTSFEIWADAMELHSQAQRFSWLLVAGGREIQRIYSSTPHSSEEITELKFPWIEVPQYRNAICRLDSYFESKSNPRLERQLLIEMNQQNKEPFNAYLVRLRTQAMRCGFDDKRLNEEVFFQIMRGARSEKVRQYAATEVNKSVDQLISYAVNEEIKQQQYQKNSSESNQDRENSGNRENAQDQNIAAIGKFQRPQNKFNYQPAHSIQKCNRCGSAGHFGGARCPALGMTCRFCNLKGHFARVCMKKRKEGKHNWAGKKDEYKRKETIAKVNHEENWDIDDSQVN